MATIKTYIGDKSPVLKYGELATSGDNLLLGKGEDKFIEFTPTHKLDLVKDETVFFDFRIQLINRVAYIYIYSDTTSEEMQILLDSLPKRPNNIDKYVFKIRGIIYFQSIISISSFSIPIQFLGTPFEFITIADWQVLNPDLPASNFYTQLLYRNYINKLIIGDVLTIKDCHSVDFKELEVTFSNPYSSKIYVLELDNSKLNFDSARIYFAPYNDSNTGMLIYSHNYSKISFNYVHLVPNSRKLLSSADMSNINFIDTTLDTSTLRNGIIHPHYKGESIITLKNKYYTTYTLLLDKLTVDNPNRIGITSFIQE